MLGVDNDDSYPRFGNPMDTPKGASEYPGDDALAVRQCADEATEWDSAGVIRMFRFEGVGMGNTSTSGPWLILNIWGLIVSMGNRNGKGFQMYLIIMSLYWLPRQ